MRRLLIIALIAALLGGYWYSNLQPVPFTDRNQFVIVSPEQAENLGATMYAEELNRSVVLSDGPIVDQVNEIGGRIAAAAEPEDPGYDWTFTVIESEIVNAFALPGGYTAVYTGILPVAENDNGLAAIIGHEIAHALARHGSERLSQRQFLQFAMIGVGFATGDLSPEAQRAAVEAFGLGAQLGLLMPYSRKHESEADYIGLILMARACYDPQEAPRLWERMAAMNENQQRPPEFISTHPSNETRIAQLRAWMPEALEIYNANCR